MDYDVIFIGSGHANWHAAMSLQAAGKKVAMIEKDTLAGTCTNYGCNAKILLDGAADVLHQVKAYQGKGLQGDVKIDWSALMAYKHQTIDPIHNMLAQQFEQAGIEIIMGTASFIDSHTVRVNHQRLSAQNIVIGTGQRPRHLIIPGHEYLHDSRDFLDLPDLPDHITFIGAGIVALEFAMLARYAGSDVTILEFAPSTLRGFDSVYVEKVLAEVRAIGIKIHFKESVKEVSVAQHRLKVTTESGLTIPTDYVVEAAGRIPNVEELNLAAIGVAFSPHGIEVDDHLMTTCPHVYASGDVIAKKIPRLTPTATFESNYLAAYLTGQLKAPIHYPAIASVVFTLPRLAQVGVTRDQALAQSDQYQVQTVQYGQRLRFQTKNEPQAEATLIFNQDKYLVGASVYGDEAPELINFLTLIISQKMTLLDLNQAILAFPSQSIGVLSMLTPFLKKM